MACGDCVGPLAPAPKCYWPAASGGDGLLNHSYRYSSSNGKEPDEGERQSG